MPAGTADVVTHVLDDAKHRHIDLVEHGNPLAGICQRHILGRRDDHRRRGGHLLGQRQLDIASARGMSTTR